MEIAETYAHMPKEFLKVSFFQIKVNFVYLV